MDECLADGEIFVADACLIQADINKRRSVRGDIRIYGNATVETLASDLLNPYLAGKLLSTR